MLSGNRNFEGRVNVDVSANYLMCPPLVVAYALAGSIGHNFDTDPLGIDPAGQPVYLKDIWPTQAEVAAAIETASISEGFRREYATVTKATPVGRVSASPLGDVYQWEPDSTYIRKAPFFDGIDQHARARHRHPRRARRSPSSATPSPPTTSRPPATSRETAPPVNTYPHTASSPPTSTPTARAAATTKS